MSARDDVDDDDDAAGVADNCACPLALPSFPVRRQTARALLDTPCALLATSAHPYVDISPIHIQNMCILMTCNAGYCSCLQNAGRRTRGAADWGEVVHCARPGACPSPRLCSRLCLSTCACTLGYSSCVCGASLGCDGRAGRRTHDAGMVAANCRAAIAARTPSDRHCGQQDGIGE